MSSKPRILVADDDQVLVMLLREMLREAGYEVLTAHNGDELVRRAQAESPDLLLVDLMMPLMDGFEAIRQLRNDTRTAHLPMIILTARGDSAEVVTGFDSGADDYIVKPYDIDVLLARIRGHLRRAAQLPVRNPLTGLPGNVLLQAEIERQLESSEPFSLLYVDLDNFKAFNDAYGFARGDRAIHLLASVLSNTTAPEDFVGHIGGDDFAVIHSGPEVEALCQRLIQAFDAQVPSLYDGEDLERGYLQGFDRQGVMRRFGLLSLSIAVVSTYWRPFKTVDDMSKAAAELKSVAKLTPGSSYELDRRRRQRGMANDDQRVRPLPTALLVSADEQLRSAIANELRRHSYRPLIADGLVAAHSILAHDPSPDLIVADISIGPQIWDICREIGPQKAIVLTEGDMVVPSDRVRAAVLRNAPLATVVAQVIAQIPSVGVDLAEVAEPSGLATPNDNTTRHIIEELLQRAARYEREAREDSLTGLINLRYFTPQLAKLFAASPDITVALLDIDNFRQINLQFSHQIGDTVLKRIAELLRTHCREHDILARYAGEEFAMIFPNTSLQEAVVICERIRAEIDTEAWATLDPRLHLTVSIGVVARDNAQTPEQMLAAADALLATAKQNGKNQVRTP